MKEDSLLIAAGVWFGFCIGIVVTAFVFRPQINKRDAEIQDLQNLVLKQNGALKKLDELFSVEQDKAQELRRFIYQELKKGAGAK